MGPSGTLRMQAGSASTPAAGQIVPADTLDTDLGNLMDHSMISVEDFIEDSIVPSGSGAQASANILPISGGAKAFAEEQEAQVVPSQPMEQQQQNHMAEENAHLRQELDAVRFQLSETKIVAQNYARTGSQLSEGRV